MEDILIKDARIIDGTGNPWYRGEVFVSNGKVADVGKTLYDKDYKSSDVKVIDAEDKVVSPGFIDIHSHSDFLLLRDRSNIAKISQGVTTEIVGQCGLSPAPVSQQYLELLKEYTSFIHAEAKLDWSWTSLGEYMKMMEENKVGLNIGFCIGHGTVRLAVMGFRESKASLKELYEMKDLVAEAMEDGAYGITSGLIYPPGVYADTEELIELCKVVASYGGVYTTHMRNESDSLLDAVQEALTIGRKSKIPVQISHHKACGKQNWGRVKESLKLIEQARDEGIDVTIDQYPYPAHSTTLSAIIPPWAQEGGIDALCERLSDNKEREKIKDFIKNRSDWENHARHCGSFDNILISSAPMTLEVQGKTVRQAADDLGVDSFDLAFDVIRENRGAATACFFAMCDDDVKYVLKNRLVMIGSDGISVPKPAQPHPRMYGTFPRVLGHYARDEKVITLEDAVKKMTSLPAVRMGLYNKGILTVGKDADLVIFDPETIKDKATYTKATSLAEGIDYVIVNGQIVFDHGKPTGNLPGRVLKKCGGA